jgi:hypothetical protein
MISDEMRRRKLTTLAELSPETRKRLSQIYLELSRSLPEDPAAMSYAQMVRSEAASPLVVGARQVLQQIVRAAADNRALPRAAKAVDKDAPTRREGDALTTYLIREAAKAADAVSPSVRHEAFILAVSIGLSDSQPALPLTPKANILRAIESPSERAVRVTVLGEPTMRGSRDIARQFLAGAQLADTAGVGSAQEMVLTRELADAQSPVAFSFADLAASRAGIRFAQNILDRKIMLSALAAAFSVDSFMPEVSALPAKLATAEFAAQFGGKNDPRFLAKLKAIDDSISQLPGYRPASAVFGK